MWSCLTLSRPRYQSNGKLAVIINHPSRVLSICVYYKIPVTWTQIFLVFLQNWLAFDSLHRPLFKEHNDVSFPNNVLPAKNHNFAFCQVRMVAVGGEVRMQFEWVPIFSWNIRKHSLHHFLGGIFFTKLYTPKSHLVSVTMVLLLAERME